MLRRSLLPFLAAATLLVPPARPLPAQPATAPAPATSARARAFAQLVAELSEPGGYFDTDNLISNERSYLHVIGALERRGVRGGAYVGVGPDQNFSYIARVRPSVAYVIDIRRDNMLQHLMFKALFASARNRAEYLALWTGRPVPADPAQWSDLPIDSMVAYVDRTPATDASARSARERVVAEARRSGIPLTSADVATIERFHGAFIEEGLDLRFTSSGRAPRSYYPTLRDLILERDLQGRRVGYLVREADFQFVKGLQRRDLVIPVVGNLAGPHALAAIGRDVRRRGERISAFYTSNVEDYLLRDRSFPRFAATVRELPRDRRSVIIRSYFGGTFRDPHPDAVPSYFSTQLLQPIDAFVAESNDYETYRDLAMRSATEPK